MVGHLIASLDIQTVRLLVNNIAYGFIPRSYMYLTKMRALYGFNQFDALMVFLIVGEPKSHIVQKHNFLHPQKV